MHANEFALYAKPLTSNLITTTACLRAATLNAIPFQHVTLNALSFQHYMDCIVWIKYHRTSLS